MDLQPVKDKVRERRMRPTGHCIRHLGEPAVSKLTDIVLANRRLSKEGKRRTTNVDTQWCDCRANNTADPDSVMPGGSHHSVTVTKVCAKKSWETC